MSIDEALQMLKENEKNKSEREELMKTEGYPAYTTQIGFYLPVESYSCNFFLGHFYINWKILGWIGYSDEKIKQLCGKYLSEGFTGFKIKVGDDLESDKRRCGLVRSIIGAENFLVRIYLFPFSANLIRSNNLKLNCRWSMPIKNGTLKKLFNGLLAWLNFNLYG